MSSVLESLDEYSLSEEVEISLILHFSYFKIGGMETDYGDKSIQNIENFDDEIFLVIIIAFVLTILIFTVRITSLRTVLLSIVFSGLLCLLLGLVLILVLESNMFAIRDIYVVLTILWLTYLSVIALSIFSNKKQYRGIAMNTSLFGFLPITITTLIAIGERYNWWYPSSNTEEIYYYYYYYWYFIRELIISIVGILLSFVFVGLYTNVIKRWKAMPE